MEIFKRLERKVDYLIEALGAVRRDLDDVQKVLSMLQETRSDIEIADGLNSIMNYDGRGKRDG